MTEKELRLLFEQKMADWEIPFSEANWEAFVQMQDPSEPLSEQEYRKLFNDKLKEASFPFNPAAWEEMEAQLGPEGGMNDEEMRRLFDAKVTQGSFAFNEDNWNRMEHLLDEQEQRPLAYYWRSVAAILLLALSSSLLWSPSSTSQPGIAPVYESRTGLESPLDKKAEPKAAEGSPASLDAEMPQSSEVATNNLVKGSAAPQAQQAPSSNQNRLAQEPSSITDLYTEQVEPSVALPSLSTLGIKAMSLFTEPRLALMLSDKPELPPVSKKEPYIPLNYSSLYAVGGPNISPSFNGQWSSGFNAGLVYEYSLDGVSSFEIGLIYNQAAIGIETMSDSTFFGLGRTNVNTHRHYKSIASLRVPISYKLTLASKHSINVGMYSDLNLRVRMDETVSTTIFKQDPKVENRSFNQSMDSFEALSFGASFSYAYQYNDRLSLGLTYTRGLSDITKDDAFGFESDHRPEQLSLDLRYRIFKR